MIEEVSRNEMLSTIHYMTEHFPYRLAGSPCEAAASRYVTERLKQYGLEVENKEFYTYNSDPMYSKVTVLEPEMEIDSLPCAHIRATKPEGEIFELIYVGNGDYAAYKDIDVTGKMVLVEVSYAPPVPEKARIAYEMGAAGIMCMNWGNDEEVICRRGLKGVWGNPTEANFHCIPEIVGVGVTRGAGLKLKQLCLEGRKVEVKVTAIADRTWSIVHQPTAILHGNGSSDEFLLVCSHLDAWKPGVTCNATGNATTLEICRILSKHRQELDRDVYFVFWDGHEVAEAAGSTWFVDNNWDNLNKHCVCYMHIDSTGVKETELYEIKASEELLGLAKKNINEVLPELELRAMALKKIGDQSFMGIGVSSITQRKSFTKEYMEHAHGATLGWWNHTIEDGEDKCDPVALEEDTRATLKVLYDLATAKLLPYDFSDKISVFRANVQKVADKFGDHMDFTDLQDNLKTVEHQVNEIQAMKEGLSNEQAKLYNEFVKMVARQITNVTMTCADKYSQDSYDNQEQPFSEMTENAQLADWIGRFQYWDAQNHAYIHLNPLQSHDVNLTLQKRYAFLQWEQGSGKTPAAIFTGQHRVEMGAVHSIWVISSAISIRNNWDVILKGTGFSYVFVERLADLQRIRPGDFVILTLNKVSQYKKQIGRYIKQLGYKIQFIFDESDNISNPSSKQTLSVLSCFRRCKYKLLTTGTSTRNNISEFAPQLELLYNNSINMISWCRTLYSYDKRSADMEHKENPYYAMPIPAYKKGYRLFANSHLPEKITVFGVGQRNQDIYNADELDRLLGKTVITRTFEEVTGKDIRRIHQMPIPFLPEEREVYNIVLKEFYRIQREYYSSTGNSRKDALMRLIQQITLLLRISAAPDCMKEYEGETPLKEMAVVEALARWPEEVVAIGVRHTTVLDRYAAAIREYLPERPLFVVTGSTVTFAKRRALRDVLRDSQNGILLCTQQSLPSSVNFEFVNKIIIPEMHYNNAGMSQFYMRFVRYTSTEKKDLYFPIYIGSLESNLMQMVLAKEKLTMFMKGQDADMDEIYAKFGVDYDLLSTLMTRETDDEGHLRIHWGEQKIA